MVDRSLWGRFLQEPSTSDRVRYASKTKASLIQRYHIMPLARALEREDGQQLTGHLDPDPLVFRIQQMGDPSQILNPEMR
jgi:hypothetical protein